MSKLVKQVTKRHKKTRQTLTRKHGTRSHAFWKGKNPNKRRWKRRRQWSSSSSSSDRGYRWLWYWWLLVVSSFLRSRQSKERGNGEDLQSLIGEGKTGNKGVGFLFFFRKGESNRSIFCLPDPALFGGLFSFWFVCFELALNYEKRLQILGQTVTTQPPKNKNRKPMAKRLAMWA